MSGHSSGFRQWAWRGQPASQPSENLSAAQISVILEDFSCAIRLPNRSCEMVIALCRFTAQSDFIPSSSLKTTSDGTPRIVDVTGATVTVAK
jgi:hypothetical protein